MTIPKSYEALAADLASEKILSKTLHGQKEMYMMLADQRKVELDAALARDAALRESLTDKRDEYNKLGDRYDDLQQRLTVAEQQLGIQDRFAGYLLDHCEGEVIYEESLQYWLSESIKLHAESLKPVEDYNELDDDEDLEVFDDQ